jgi:hypothetical protein
MNRYSTFQSSSHWVAVFWLLLCIREGTWKDLHSRQNYIFHRTSNSLFSVPAARYISINIRLRQWSDSSYYYHYSLAVVVSLCLIRKVLVFHQVFLPISTRHFHLLHFQYNRGGFHKHKSDSSSNCAVVIINVSIRIWADGIASTIQKRPRRSLTLQKNTHFLLGITFECIVRHECTRIPCLHWPSLHSYEDSVKILSHMNEVITALTRLLSIYRVMS